MFLEIHNSFASRLPKQNRNVVEKTGERYHGAFASLLGERWQYAVLPPASVTDQTFVQGDLSGW